MDEVDLCSFFFQAEDGIRDADVTGVQTCALPICLRAPGWRACAAHGPCACRCRLAGLPRAAAALVHRSEEHTSELQSRPHLVCRLLLEKKKIQNERPHAS